MFRKLLIANRGEIARRINRVAQQMGISTVAVYSDADASLPFVREATQAVRIGPPPPKSSYLDVAALLEAARTTGAEAVHPGYGFVSENPEFARACTEAGLVFVGPPPEAMERIKDKSQVRKRVQEAGVPIVPGSDGVVPDGRSAAQEAERIGFPVLCKAAGGGGGIGMAVANNQAALEKVYRQCVDRARAAFGREGVYLERYFAAPRHIEVQLLGDRRGRIIHLLERECSIQRRHQKVVEEAPSPFFAGDAHAEMAEQMFQAALLAGKALRYQNAGTVEFLVADGSFYFIEVNARLQVEHPITELTTGVDLIGWQLRLAAGEELAIDQQQVRRTGAAIEFRIYAEDPIKFLPSPGTITRFRAPSGEGVRLDAGYEEGNTVTPYYDPLIAKLIVTAPTRPQAIERSARALEAFSIEGLQSNLPLHRRIAQDPAFRAGQLDTAFLERHAKP